MAIVENKRPIHYVVDVLKYLFLILFALVTLLPLLNLVAKGLSGESAVISGRVLFWPMNPTLKTYQYVLKGNSFFNAFKVSVFLTVFGSVAAVIVTAMTAYPLSRSACAANTRRSTTARGTCTSGCFCATARATACATA